MLQTDKDLKLRPQSVKYSREFTSYVLYTYC